MSRQRNVAAFKTMCVALLIAGVAGCNLRLSAQPDAPRAHEPAPDAPQLVVESSAFPDSFSAEDRQHSLPAVRHAATLVQASGHPCTAVTWIGMTAGEGDEVSIRCDDQPLGFRVAYGAVSTL